MINIRCIHGFPAKSVQTTRNCRTAAIKFLVLPKV